MCRRSIQLISFVFVLGFVVTGPAGAADPGLVGWWKFEETGGTLLDQSDNHNDGTAFNGVRYQQPGQVGYALGFDGVDDYVVVGTNARPTDTFSFGGWFKTTATHEIESQATSGTGGVNNQRYAFDPQHGGDQNAGAGLSIGTNGIAVYEHGSNYMPTTAAYPTALGTEWNHIMVVYNSKQPTIYLNGRAVHTGLKSPRGVVSAPIQFGGMAYGYFEGLMDEVRIYSRALSAAEVRKVALRPDAWAPSPADGATLLATWVNLAWKPGDLATSHDVYLGESLDDVNNSAAATFRGNVASPFFTAGFVGVPYPDGLVPGTTYYWRIDEVNQAEPNSPWKGDVWSFSIPPRKAHRPGPPDGAQYAAVDVTLSWTAGLNAKLHYVYFGDNLDTVSNATGGAPRATPTYTPAGPLAKGKTYYWRVDEFDGTATYKGDVWRLSVIPDIPVAEPNLVAWYKFEAGESTRVVDFSGRGNHGTTVPGPRGAVQWVDGLFNLALEFLGDDRGYVEMPPGIVTTAKGSILMWINTTQGDAANNDEGMLWWACQTSAGDGYGGENEIHINIDDPTNGELDFFLEEDGTSKRH